MAFKVSHISVFFLVLWLVGCGSPEPTVSPKPAGPSTKGPTIEVSPTSPKPTLQIQKLSVEPGSLTLKKWEAKPLEITVEANGKKGKIPLKNIKFTSADPKVAVVKGDAVSGESEGRTDITVQVQNLSQKIAVTVESETLATQPPNDPTQPVGAAPATVQELQIKSPLVELAVGKGLLLDAAVVMSDGSANRDILWSSEDESLVSVDEEGKARRYAPGEVKIFLISRQDSRKSGVITLTGGGNSSSTRSTLIIPPPAFLRAQNVGSSSTTLVWASVPDANTYEVTVEGRPPMRVDNNQQLVLNDLMPNRGYTAQVVAVIGQEYSLPQFVEFKTSAAGAVQNLRVQDVTESRLQFSWDDLEGASGYKVLRDGQPVGETTQNRYTLDSLQPGSTLTVSVSAILNGQETPHSSELTVTLKPAAPTELAVKDVSSTALGLSWKALPDVDGYTVYLNGKTVTTLSRSANSYLFTGLTPDTNYQMGVSSFNSAGESQLTTIAGKTSKSITPPTCTPLTGAATGDVSKQQYKLYCFTPTGTGDYQIVVTPLSGDPDLFVGPDAQVNKTNASYRSENTGEELIELLSASGTYYVAVYGYQAANYRIEAKNKISPPPPCEGAPGMCGGSATLTVAAPNGGETLIKGQATTIRWSADNYSDNVQIKLLRGNNTVQTLASSIPASQELYTFTPTSSLTDSSDYRILIQATAQSSLSDMSDSAFTIQAPDTTNPTVLDVTLTSTSASVNAGASTNLSATVQMSDGTTNSNVTWSSSNSSVASVSGGTVTGVSAGTATITARATADSTQSATATITVSALPPNVTISVGSPSNGQTLTKGTNYNVTWSANASGNVKVKVFKGSSEYAVLGANELNDGVLVFNPPSNWADGSDYRIQVMDLNSSAAAYSGYFTIAAAALLPPSPPSLNSPSSGETVSPGNINFSWGTSAGAGRYHLMVCTNSSLTSGCVNPDGDMVGVEPSTSTSTTVNLSAGTYYWAVRAICPGDACSWGSYSSVRSLTVSNPTPTCPAIPTGVSVAYSSGQGGNYLTWNSVAGASGYKVYWGTSSNVTTSSIYYGSTSSTAALHTGVSGGFTYYYKVLSTGACDSGLSSTASVTVPQTYNPTVSVTSSANASVPVLRRGTGHSFTQNGTGLPPNSTVTYRFQYPDSSMQTLNKTTDGSGFVSNVWTPNSSAMTGTYYMSIRYTANGQTLDTGSVSYRVDP